MKSLNFKVVSLKKTLEGGGREATAAAAAAAMAGIRAPGPKTGAVATI
jgi:hypothetical protein